MRGDAEYQAHLKMLKTFYFVATLAYKYKTTHLKFFLVSEWGSTKDSYEIKEKADKMASDIVAALSQQNGIPYSFVRFASVSKQEYTMLCKYFTHYIDASLRWYNTSSNDDENEEADG